MGMGLGVFGIGICEVMLHNLANFYGSGFVFSRISQGKVINL